MNAWYPRLTAHSLVIAISVLTYVLTTRAERERRPPAIAIAWVLGMLALPYLALPMYLLFGRRKLQRRKKQAAQLPPHAEHWAADLIDSFDLPAATPAAIRMHHDGGESAAALFEIMDAAEHRLDVCTYILGNDAFGHAALERLMACASRGVQVRLMIDGVGALQLPRARFQQLEQAGVATAIFSPLFARRTQGPRNLRNHRKMAVADGKAIWAGGRNLAAEYFTGTTRTPPWGDLTFDLRGDVAHAAETQFESDWVWAGGRPASQERWEMVAANLAVAASTPRRTPSPGAVLTATSASQDGIAQFLPSGPDQTEDTVHALLIDGCFHARERIVAVTPYFVPDASLETALRLAARRGVKVDLCIPAKSNHRLADFARSRSLRALAQVGVNVHLLPAMNHAKAIVFDRSLAVSGSVNLDSRSLLLNYESAVVFYSEAQIDWLAQWIEALLPKAVEFDRRPPTLARDVCEGLLLTVAYQL